MSITATYFVVIRTCDKIYLAKHHSLSDSINFSKKITLWLEYMLSSLHRDLQRAMYMGRNASPIKHDTSNLPASSFVLCSDGVSENRPKRAEQATGKSANLQICGKFAFRVRRALGALVGRALGPELSSTAASGAALGKPSPLIVVWE